VNEAAKKGSVITVTHGERGSIALALKRGVQALALLWISPRLAAYGLARRVWGRDRAFLAASEGMAKIPGMRGVYCRQAFYRRTLEACGRDVYFGWQSTFSMPQAKVGEGVYIGRRCSVGFADIEAAAMLADGVQILSGGREHGRATGDEGTHRDQPQEYREVTIGHGAWLGTNAVIMADVGAGAIVGAGAVVTKPVPARSVAVGVPAVVVKTLSDAP
jgi:acetyltransferase-like isoleucine patch superfamily enzyme